MAKHNSQRLCDVDVEFHHQTEKAWLVSADGDKARAVWLPKSAVEVNSWNKENDLMNLTMTEYLATEKGLV